MEKKPYFAQVEGEAQIEVYAKNIFDASKEVLDIYKRDWWDKNNRNEVSGTSIQFRIWSQYGDSEQ
jgi:hypothetical protein